MELSEENQAILARLKSDMESAPEAEEMLNEGKTDFPIGIDDDSEELSDDEIETAQESITELQDAINRVVKDSDIED